MSSEHASPIDITRISLARGLFYGDVEYIRTRLMDEDNENCVLCGCAIAEGPVTFLPKQERYVGSCCFDLARLHGVTRDEHGSRVGKPSHLGRVLEIPAGAVIELAERIAIKNQRDAQR